MSAQIHTDDNVKAFRFIDYCAIILLLAAAAYSINLFRLDLFQSLDARKDEPVGTIVIKKNIVQRRFSDRVVWDRLFANSSVYSGNLIRVAEFSSATLAIGENRIDLNENTLIRIQRVSNGDAPFQIELSEGVLSLSAGGDIALDVAGCQLQITSGTALVATTGKDGAAIQINEGSAQLSGGDGPVREIAAGRVVALDIGGAERTEKNIAVMTPRPNAHYLQNAGELMVVDFLWSRDSLAHDDTLLLETARDRNFTQFVRSVGNFYDSARAVFDAGPWYWRLSLENKTIKEGRFTVGDALAPILISPIADSLFRYQTNPPNMLFQWSEIEDILFYILEVCDTPDFTHPQLSRQLKTSSIVESNMEPGTWYWRVRPVFSSVYNDLVIYSPAASFRIEHARDSLAPALELPAAQPAAPEQAATEEAAQKDLPPPLPAPANRLPANGHHIGVEELKTQRSIIFSWAPVAGANGYIFSLYQQVAAGRRQILRREPEDITHWTLTDLSVLDNGTFIWRVEAVSRNQAGTIERQGRIGENSFSIGIPAAAEVQVQDTGALYGN